MLKKLRVKFIMTSVLITAVTMLVVMIAVFAYRYNVQKIQLFGQLSSLLSMATNNNDTTKPVIGGGFSQPNRNSFDPAIVVVIPAQSSSSATDTDTDTHTDTDEGSDDSDLGVTEVDIIEFNATMSEESVTKALEVINSRSADKTSGYILSLGLAYAKGTTPAGSTVISFMSIVDMRSDLTVLLITELVIFATVVALAFVVSLIISANAIRPVKEAWIKQKQFLADASHELKTPLTVILANNNILQEHGDELVSEQEQWITSTQDEAGRMKGLIDEMLFLAKSDANSMPVNITDVNISDILEEAALTFEPVAFENNVMIDTHITPNVTISTDRSLFDRLVRIFLDNAVKHSESGGTVLITLMEDGTKKVIKVNNGGDIIGPDDLPHIFDRFYKAEASRTSSGYGLGLAIASSIAETLHGTIGVTSNTEIGTTFTITF